MSSKRRAPRPKSGREPAKPPAKPSRRGLLWAAAALLVVAAVVLVPILTDNGPEPPQPTPPEWPNVAIDGAELPLHIVTTRAGRERLVPLQVQPDRPLSRFFRRYAAPFAVLFPYPDTAFRSHHLDDVSRGGAVVIVFLKEDGVIDSVWPLGDREDKVLSHTRVRYTLFVPGSWFETHRIETTSRIVLPAEAVAAAARAEIENPPITDPPPARIKIGGVALEVEVAARLEPRSRGLMFREYLADGKGMIFLFPSASEQKFWMRNTRIPLDIAYIGEDYRIRNIVPMRPHDLDRSRKYGSEGPVIIALETPGGWFRKNGVRKGALLEASEELKALQRNADP